MLGGARRLLLCPLHAFARRVRLAWCALLVLLAVPAAAEITSARYTEPTTRYAHGVLGDAIEYGALELKLRGGKKVTITLPQDRVFEDLEPRLFDVTGDGALEAIVIESSQDGGARLAIYNEKGLVAATPHIGQRNRWLAPVGVADLDGDGLVELAYIDRPHLAKTLRVWRYESGALTQVASRKGLTNHRIGEDFISGGLRDCGDGTEMITADGSWGNVVATRFDGKKLRSQTLWAFRGQNSLKTALDCKVP
ncbi:VCBS repeat protein [Shimia isoporae]|uniref:VCBS repeat protein n=1 Tax=Shimia isoporae TaxID=647720 RepID=A0A4R1N132_9RHOB|nr:VCBS repeat-containing protein [Shimia isoporae]TCK99414.1 VCBS repeat protein [Shimia isoporae]